MTSPKQKTTQILKYTGNETEYSVEIVRQNVAVVCKPATHTVGSSKVKLINRTDYNWEFRPYHGRLVAVHISGDVYAYSMKGKEGGMVRVGSNESNRRALIKNFKDEVKDLSFAITKLDVILGCVDAEGNVLIYQILQGNEIQYTLLLHIYQRHSVGPSDINYRIIWCPFLSNFDDEDTVDDSERMFVLLNGTKAEVCNVALINNKHGTGPLYIDDSYHGYIGIEHNGDLVDAAFSTDGTAIAIASNDGFVKFFQLYMVDEEKQKCLHEWRPHDGKPLSSIIFIDNIMEYSSVCWKFMITGAQNNAEIKLWSCETWTCLQMITFKPDPTSHTPSTLFFNISVDYTSRYLVVSDINNRVMYVMQLERNEVEQTVRATTLSRFLLPAPFLSFHILSARPKRLPYPANYDDDDDDNAEDDMLSDNQTNGDDIDEDDDDDDAVNIAQSLKMMVVQPKRIQVCNVVFQTDALICKSAGNFAAQDQDEEEKIPKLDELHSSVTLLIQQQQQQQQTTKSLMTPEDFRNPAEAAGAKSPPLPGQGGQEAEASLSEASAAVDMRRLQKENCASGGSSPSREVQEILSLNNSFNAPADFFDPLGEAGGQPEPSGGGGGAAEADDDDDAKVGNGGGADGSPVGAAGDAAEACVWFEPTTTTDFDGAVGQSAASAVDLQSVNFRISSLENTICEQGLQIQALLEEMRKRDQRMELWQKEMEGSTKKLHQQLVGAMDSVAVQVQKISNANSQLERQRYATEISNACTLHMRGLVINELCPRLQNQMGQLIDHHRKQMDQAFTQRLATTDHALKESIVLSFNNSTLTETLSKSVAKFVTPSLDKCYRDIVYTSLVPSLEKVCSQMFQQINDTFSQGTKEYTSYVENYMERQRKEQEKGKDMLTQMQTVSENIKMNTDKLVASMTANMNKQIATTLKGVQDRLTIQIREAVANEVGKAFKNHASVFEDSVINAVRSRAVTPAPHVDTQTTLTQIQYHLNKQHYDEAFQLALSAENLPLVITVCKKVDINTVFGDECLLQQSCLLALIQQLSVDLNDQTELKLSYIRAAMLVLSTDATSTKHFVPKVMRDLLKQLNVLTANSNASVKHVREAKLLKMAAEGMVLDK